MQLIGITPTRNEGWCLPVTIPAAMQWLDKLIILDHGSTDNTPEILRQMQKDYPGRIDLTLRAVGAWNEATYRQMLLERARQLGAWTICILDSDEILSKLAVNSWKENIIEGLVKGGLFRLPWLQLWRGTDCYRADDSPFGQPRVPFIFADVPNLKYEPSGVEGYQLHKRFPAQCQATNLWERDSGYGVLHLQHVVWRRVLAKQIHYQMDELVRYGKVHANYAGAVNETGLITKSLPFDWWPVSPGGLDLKAVPWQVEGIKRLLSEYGADKFKGATLFSRIGEVL